MNLGSLNAFPTYVLAEDLYQDAVHNFYVWAMAQGKAKNLTLILDSPGGNVNEALGMADFIASLPAKVHVIALGRCMSAAVLVLTAVPLQRRYTGSNTRFMVHATAHTRDGESYPCKPEIPSDEILREMELITDRKLSETYAVNERAIAVLSERTDLSTARVRELFADDSYFWPDVAQKYGIVDHILAPGEEEATPPTRRWWWPWSTRRPK